MSWLMQRFHGVFPKKRYFFIFLLYMSLFIAQGLIVTATQDSDHKYAYNTATVVLLSELSKLFSSALIFIMKNSFSEFIHHIRKSGPQLLRLYMVPAVLYCLYNNLQFTSLSKFDPTTYFVLMQFRVVITGVLFQLIFKKILTKSQWLSLFILTFGCIVKQIHPGTSDLHKFSLDINIYFVLILLQVFSSCGAGVYNEFILKNQGLDTPVMVQNVFMYFDSICCNLFLLFWNGQLTTFLTSENLGPVFQAKVLFIIFNSTCIGIVVSFFLRYLNSILKNFASALEIVFTAILARIIFGTSISAGTIGSIVLIFLATYLYSSNPVVNVEKTKEDEKVVQKV